MFGNPGKSPHGKSIFRITAFDILGIRMMTKGQATFHLKSAVQFIVELGIFDRGNLSLSTHGCPTPTLV